MTSIETYYTQAVAIVESAATTVAYSTTQLSTRKRRLAVMLYLGLTAKVNPSIDADTNVECSIVVTCKCGRCRTIDTISFHHIMRTGKYDKNNTGDKLDSTMLARAMYNSYAECGAYYGSNGVAHDMVAVCGACHDDLDYAEQNKPTGK